MSEGNQRASRLMAPLSGLGASTFNPIYEAVSGLSDGQAKRLVDAIRSILAARLPDAASAHDGGSRNDG